MAGWCFVVCGLVICLYMMIILMCCCLVWLLLLAICRLLVQPSAVGWLVVVCLFKQPRLACLVSYCLLFVIYTIICCFGLLCLIHALLLYHCLTTISYLRCVVASAVAVSFFASLMYYSKIFDNSQSVTT